MAIYRSINFLSLSLRGTLQELGDKDDKDSLDSCVFSLLLSIYFVLSIYFQSKVEDESANGMYSTSMVFDGAGARYLQPQWNSYGLHGPVLAAMSHRSTDKNE